MAGPRVLQGFADRLALLARVEEAAHLPAPERGVKAAALQKLGVGPGKWLTLQLFLLVRLDISNL